MEDAAYKPGGVARDGIENDQPVPLSLLPGDTIEVIATSTDSTTYPGLVLDGEGKVHVPIAGAIQVSGLSPQQAERKIEEALQKFDRFVRVSVLVTAQGGHYATVIGAVGTEGQVPLSAGMRVAELIAAAGGPLRTSEESGEINYVADLDAARLVRNSVPLPISIRLALSGDPKHNIIVHPTDQLFMPPGLGSRIAILGEATTGSSAMLSYRPGLRLSEALAVAGGFNANSDMEDIRVLRGPIKKPLIYQYNFEDFLDGKIGDIELAPGDVVFVTEHWAATMGEVLSRVTPLLNVLISGVNTYFLVENVKLSRQSRDALESANDN
jgi:polysaccharide export outer membrane protein